MKKRVLSVILCFAMSLGMLAGCGGAEENKEESAGTEEYKDTIVYSLDSTFTGTYLPVISLSDYDGPIRDVLYPSLYSPKADGELEPYLADGDCSVSDDGTVFTFKIRDGIKWSDGEAVTAEDVAFTFNLLADPDDDGQYANGVKHIKGVEEYQAGTADSVEGIKVIDENTVEFTLVAPYAKFEAYVGQMGIMPKHIWEGIGFAELENQDRDMIEKPVVCGPYTVVECVPGEYVQLVANEDFFLGKPLTENFFFKVVNADSITAELTAGTIDIASVTNLSNDEVSELEENGFKTKSFYYDQFQCMQFNPERNFSKDFRKAIAYAIDRDVMVDELLEGRGAVCNLVMTVASWAYPSDVKGISQNVDKAKEYLEAAGYKDINGDGFVEDPDGNEVKLSLLYPQGLVAREQSAVVIQDNLKAIGIDVELNCSDFATLVKLAFNERNFDLLLMGYGADSVDPDTTNFVSPTYGFGDDAVKISNEAATTMDKEKRKELYKELAELQQEDVPIITLYCQQKMFAYPETMINYDAGTYGNMVNVYKWAIEK